MRIVKIATYYKEALNFYYSLHPQITKKSYKEQLRDLLYFRLGWSDYYQKAFNRRGFEAYEIIANAIPLQKQWAREHNLEYDFYNVVLEQLKEISPEIIWFQNSFIFPKDFIEYIRKNLKVKLIIGNLCSPYTDDFLRHLSVYDFITTCAPNFVQALEAVQIDSILLYHAFDTELLDQISVSDDKKYQVLFIGSLISEEGYHVQRIKFLQYIVDKGLNPIIFAYVPEASFISYIKKFSLYFFSRIAKKIGFDNHLIRKGLSITSMPKLNFLSPKLRKFIKSPVFGVPMFEMIGKSIITLNRHGDIQKLAANMRMFEATGMGSLLLTENFPNITDLFIPEKEIVVYNSVQEAVEKINYLLENPQVARKIAKAGQNKTLREHNYDNRVKLLINAFEKYF